MKPSLSAPMEIRDSFSQELRSGEVIGSTTEEGVVRLGVDEEAKISIEDGALRFAPLDTPGWGRQGVAYGPFARKAGLALAFFLLNGHNNSQTAEPGALPGQLLGGRPSMGTPLPFKAHYTAQTLRENLAVGWFDHPVPSQPLDSGQALVVQGHSYYNGRLCVAKQRGLHHLLLGIQNNPLYLVSLLRERGVVYYGASLEGSRHLPALPKLRPLAIDPYNQPGPNLYAGIYQSILGEQGYRADTRVYGVRVADVPEWQGYGTALLFDPQPQLGRKAPLGGVWRLQGPGMLFHLPEPGGLFHVCLSAPASLIWRYHDPQHYLVLELNTYEVRLKLQYGLRQAVLASEPYGAPPGQPHWLQVLDDGLALTLTLDGRPLFSESPLLEPRLAQATGVGLAGQATDLEVHPRQVSLPPALELGLPWQAWGHQTVFVPHLNQPSEDLLVFWEPTLGQGVLSPAEGGVRIEAAGGERTFYTVPWAEGGLVDLEAEILPPGTHPKERHQSRAGLCLWQDAQHYLVVALHLDDQVSLVAAALRFAGYEDPYDTVFSRVPDLLYHGVPVRLRVVCDGEQFQVYLEGEPVLYRALRDIYPGAGRLWIRRVGLALSGFGRDTGSIFRSWLARK